MEYRILGPLEVVRQGSVLPPPANKPRALLAVLLLHRGEVVTLERLADDLWGERPPATATKSIQLYISQLRKVLGDGVLETRGRGYVLVAEPEQLDAVRFERLLETGAGLLAAGRAGDAASTLSEALALWRGPPLADFTYEPWAQAEIARLEDLRLAALEERIDADLALGRHSTLIGELSGLVERNPARERLLGQLMLALYRSGRQTEALDAYHRQRRRLMDELGIEPASRLREIEAAILRQDADLQGPERTAPAPLSLRKPRRRPVLTLAAVTLLLAGLAAGVVALVVEPGTPIGNTLQPLTAASCSPVNYRPGARPQHLIVSDQPLQGSEGVLGNQIAAAVEYVLRENEFRAGGRDVAYQACDGDFNECEKTGRRYADNPDVVGVVGPLGSGCAAELIPVANQARPGPLAVVSPSNTMVGLTRAESAEVDESQRFYPTGVRNYVRVVPADDFQFAALAMLAHRLGIRRAFVLATEPFGRTADAFSAAAEKLGLPVVGSTDWYSHGPPRAVARLVKRARADAVFLAGALGDDGTQMVKALRAVLGRDVQLLAPDGFSGPELVARVGRAGEGMRISVPGVDPRALTGPGRRLMDELRETIGEPHPYTVSAAQATQLLLDAIGRSDGTRRSVVSELFASEVRGGLLGDFSVTPSGDTTANRVSIYRIEDGERRLDRVLTPPLNLVVRR